MSAGLADARDVRAFDLRRLPDGFYEDPYPWYAALRARGAVSTLRDDSVLVVGYEAARAVYKDARTFSSDKRAEFAPKFGAGRLYRHHTTSLVFNDAPDHTRVRRRLMGALAPPAVAAREAALRALVETLLDRMAGRPEVDLIADFAAAIPVEVIGDLLAIPRADRRPLRDWSLAILGALEPAPGVVALARGETALEEFHAYLELLIAERRQCPGDPERDLLSRLLVEAPDDPALAPAELVENCVFLLNAAHETTTNLIGNLLELLARFPEARRRLADAPSLIEGAIEEALRFESPNQLGNRRVTQDIDLDGVRLRSGALVTLGIAAANRDPAAFDRPDEFQVDRTPNRHLAFGSGPHQCLGLGFARLEARVAVEGFLRRFPHYGLAAGVQRSRRARFRGFTTLPAHPTP